MGRKQTLKPLFRLIATFLWFQIDEGKEERYQKEHKTDVIKYWPIPVTARSKAWICDRSLAGIAGSNAAEGMDVCLLWVLCVVR
jgi:hypothetical protein